MCAMLVLGVLYLPLALLQGFLIATGCFTEDLAEARGVSGFDFEVSETDCWHSPAISVFVSKPGRSKKTRLLQYTRTPYANPVPIITSIGEDAVLISLSSVDTLDCARPKWKADKSKTLVVKYKIGDAVYPGLGAQPPEC